MQTPSRLALETSATATLWIARTLTVLILGFWGFFLVAHLVGDAGAPSRPLRFGDYVLLTMVIVWLFGLALALKWNRLGACVTLAAVAVAAVFNWRVVMFPMTVIPVTAGLYLLASYLQSTTRRQAAVSLR